jgi:N-hydroxyarylamine O-acetyltransferase
MQLAAYLDRIGYRGSTAPTLDTLFAIHRAQAYTIPYEGLDIQLGRPVDLDPARIFDKLVLRRRGGWCYETNGLLGWALGKMGFRVRRITGGVHRRERGDAAFGNHLTLLVDPDEAGIERTWLCDLGLGDALRAPIPLTEGLHADGGLVFRLERLPDGCWRFHNHGYGTPESFDFRDAPADEGLFAAQNRYLQTDPQSHFVLNAEAVHLEPQCSVTLLGRVLRHASTTGVNKELIDTPEALEAALDRHFGIGGIPVAILWPLIVARHDQLFPSP